MTIQEGETPIENEQPPKTVWLFPGQGTQSVGMGEKLFQTSPIARSIYRQADNSLKRSITNISFRGPEERLNETQFTQLAIFVYIHACLETLRNGKVRGFDEAPIFAAGHSLGEYNALVACGALSFEDGLKLVQARGTSMQYACDIIPSGLVAVKEPSEDEVNYLTGEGLEIALINTNEQTVFGGKRQDLERVSQRLGRRATIINVAGAFHTSFMTPAVKIFSPALDTTRFVDAKIPIVANTTAKEIRKWQDIREELRNQLIQPVLWRDTLTFLDQQGMQRAFELGDKGILTNMSRRVLNGESLGNIDVLENVPAAVAWRHAA